MEEVVREKTFLLSTHFTNLYIDTTMIKIWLGEIAPEVIQRTEEDLQQKVSLIIDRTSFLPCKQK